MENPERYNPSSSADWSESSRKVRLFEVAGICTSWHEKAQLFIVVRLRPHNAGGLNEIAEMKGHFILTTANSCSSANF